MSDTIKIIGAVLIIIVLAMLVLFGADLAGIFWEKKVGVLREDVRRTNFEHTKSYTQGQKQELVKLYHEYITSDKAGKAAIASVVRQMYADYDSQTLSPELSAFMNQCLYQN